MSNIYIQEPPTSGKVLLVTSVGDIDLELWTRETPKACRNFIQLCMEGYYNGTIFHRVVKDFIVQGGDPNGDGTGGDSIYDGTFKDEFHSRLRFSRRGLLAMANAGKDDNASQFFFTLGATPELQNKHTIFGKVTGETIYNMLKLEDGLVDDDERPQYPQKIIRTEVLNNPFTDIVPRTVASTETFKPKKKEKKAGVKNFKLLSFGEEAEEDEEETAVAIQKYSGKSKSSHDVLDDPKLSSVPAVEPSTSNSKKNAKSSDEDSSDLSGDEVSTKTTSSKAKLNSDHIKKKLKTSKNEEVIESSSEEEYYIGKDKNDEKRKKTEDIRREIRDFKKINQNERKSKDNIIKKNLAEEETKLAKQKVIDDFYDEQQTYKNKRKDIPKKGASREEFTLGLLAKFQKKLIAVKEKNLNDEDEPIKKKTKKSTGEEGELDSDEEDGDEWLAHKLQFEEKGNVLAKDASSKSDTWVDIYDPRNPLNKRRRDESKKILKTRI